MIFSDFQCQVNNCVVALHLLGKGDCQVERCFYIAAALVERINNDYRESYSDES